MAARGARHHADRHAADRPDRQRMHRERSPTSPVAASPRSSEVDDDPAIGHVQDPHDRRAQRPPRLPQIEPRAHGPRPRPARARRHDRGRRLQQVGRQQRQHAAQREPSRPAGARAACTPGMPLLVNIGITRPPITAMMNSTTSRPTCRLARSGHGEHAQMGKMERQHGERRAAAAADEEVVAPVAALDDRQADSDGDGERKRRIDDRGRGAERRQDQHAAGHPQRGERDQRRAGRRRAGRSSCARR